MSTYINATNLTTINAEQTSKNNGKIGEIGIRVKELLLNIPPQKAVALNSLGKTIMQEFNMKDLHSAYLRIQTHFKAGKCLRKWGEHLVKMQDTLGYIVIFNTMPEGKPGTQVQEMTPSSEADKAADALADIGLA